LEIFAIRPEQHGLKDPALGDRFGEFGYGFLVEVDPRLRRIGANPSNFYFANALSAFVRGPRLRFRSAGA
jgi:hypothetical protein